jgi:crotonobetainyl-CoA:carnitine CoA-transferase CaiB-like acyl-CoA transferase
LNAIHVKVPPVDQRTRPTGSTHADWGLANCLAAYDEGVHTFDALPGGPGEHIRELLQEVGYSAAEIDTIESSRIIQG